ncbi:hypothetical protein BS17DRAFT_876984 [Gyrodon lividus]|nr:hypothetical protein BS17DRAFT_876984 [Gyrodon lividus]
MATFRVSTIGSAPGIRRHLALVILDLASKSTVIVCGRRQAREDSRQSGSMSDRPALKSAVGNIVKIYPRATFPSRIQHHFNFTKPEIINLDRGRPAFVYTTTYYVRPHYHPRAYCSEQLRNQSRLAQLESDNRRAANGEERARRGDLSSMTMMLMRLSDRHAL